MNIKMLAVGAMVGASVVLGSNAFADELDIDSAIEQSVVDARMKLDEFLIKKGWVAGVNSNKNGPFIARIGIGAIQAPLGHPSYNDARSRAFDKAMLDAKAKLAQSLEEEIAVVVESKYVEPATPLKGPEQELAKAIEEMPSDSIMGKSVKLVSTKLDNALKSEGYDVEAAKSKSKEKLEDVRAKLESITSSESYQKTIKSSATCAIAGAQALYTIEVVCGKRAEIGVVMIWSPKLGEMAASMITGRAVELGIAKAPIRDQITGDKDKLLSTFGVQQKLNEKGEYVLVAYGQSGARNDSSRSAKAAYDKASLQARSLIRQFAGETITIAESQDQAETTLEYDGDLLPDYTDQSAYEQYQKTVASKLAINGIATVKSWNAVHPISGRMVYGVVMSWSPSQAELARKIKSDIEKTAKDGAKGVRHIASPEEKAEVKPNTQMQRESTKVIAKPTATERIVGSDEDGVDTDAF